MMQVHSTTCIEIILEVIEVWCLFVYTCTFVYIMYNALSPGHPKASLEATIEWWKITAATPRNKSTKTIIRTVC